MNGPASTFDYVTIGHVTRDVIVDACGGSRSQPGGGAFYSALQAARLGLRTLILTQGVPSEIRELLAPYAAELELRVRPAEHTTTLATSGTGPLRTQRVLAWAGAMDEPIELDANIVHLAPVARETPTRLTGRSDFVGITPQGLIRSWAPPDNEMSLVPMERAQLPDRFDAAVISEAERPSCEALLASARQAGAVVAVTAGARPTTVISSAGTADHPQTSLPLDIEARDDLGAGDVFAAAFFAALAEGSAPMRAATFANAVAGARVSGEGPDALASRAQVETILRSNARSS